MNSVERVHAGLKLDLDALRLNLLRQKEPARAHIFEHDFATFRLAVVLLLAL